MKKLLHKFYNFMYRYHRKKYFKYLLKSLGGKRYSKLIPNSNELAEIRQAFNSGETHAKPVYADTDSVSAYPSVMPHRRFPLVNQPGSK